VSGIHVDRKDSGLVVCPNCGKKKSIELSKYTCHKLSVSCSCGKKFTYRIKSERILPEKDGVYFSSRNGESSDIKEKVCFVAGKGPANIICEKCGFIRVVTSEEVPLLKEPFSFHCKCGNAFPCRIDERKNYRKSTQLSGEYVNRRTSRKDNMVVIDISFEGIGIMVFNAYDLQQGDLLDVDFALNDARETEIKRTVRIKRISKKRIGCDFLKDRAYDKHLGFYLLN